MVKDECEVEDFVMGVRLKSDYKRSGFDAGDFGASFIISGVLAIIFKTMVAPLERVRLILQTQASSSQIGKSERSDYSGMWNALIRIPKEQGFLSLWRGNLLNICRYFPSQSINFSFYNLYYEAFQRRIEPRTEYSHIILPFLTGGFVGMTSCLLVYPLSFCSTRIAVDVGDNHIIKREFDNVYDCAKKVYRSDGYRGFYRGALLSALGVFLYRSVYFGAYALGKRMYYKDNEKPPIIASLLFAQVACLVATFVAYPYDTISRQQMLWSGRNLKCRVPLREVINTITRKDGLSGLYKGTVANLLTTVCGSLVLVSYDAVIPRYRKLRKVDPEE